VSLEPPSAGGLGTDLRLADFGEVVDHVHVVELLDLAEGVVVEGAEEAPELGKLASGNRSTRQGSSGEVSLGELAFGKPQYRGEARGGSEPPAPPT